MAERLTGRLEATSQTVAEPLSHPPEDDASRLASSSAPAARFACFDGYRAIAASAIVAFHVAFFSGVGLRHPTLGLFLARLDAGVSLFFVVSGFLLYRPFVVAHLRERPAPKSWAFLRRRILRIVPAYWVCLAVVAYVLHTTHISGVGDALVYFGFAQIYSSRLFPGGISQAWSLCTEMTFYLALPLYAVGVRNLGRRVSFERRLVVELGGVAAVYAGGLAARAAIAFGALRRPYDARLDWLPVTMDLFALGMLLAVASAWHDGGGRLPTWVEHLGRRPWACWAGAAAAYVVVSAAVFSTSDLGRVFTPTQVMAREVLYGIVAVLLVLPGVIGAQDQGGVRRLLRSRPLAAAGLTSYGIYLVHNAVIDTYAKHAHVTTLHSSFWRLLLVTVVGTALAATALYLLVERPALRIKDRLR